MRLTREQARDLLRDLDEKADLSWASEQFDSGTEADRFLSLVTILNERYSGQCRFETGSQIQDAFFHSSINLPAEVTNSHVPIWIRLSNFGSMATYGLEDFGTFCSDREIEEGIDPDERAFIDAALESSGYVGVPSDPLLENYDGKYPGITPAMWLFRYFHYQ